MLWWTYPLIWFPNVCCTWSGQTTHMLWQNSTPFALRECLSANLFPAPCAILGRSGGPAEWQMCQDREVAEDSHLHKSVRWLSLWDWNQPAGTFYSTAMLLPYFIYLKTKHIFSRLNSLPNNLVSLSCVTLDSSLFLFSWFISMLGFIKYLLASPFFCSHICFLV